MISNYQGLLLFDMKILFVRLLKYQYTKMPMEDFELLDHLGKGAFGTVIQVRRKSDRKIYAMKKIKLQRMKQYNKINALKQIQFLASIDHPYIIAYRQAFYEDSTGNLCIVMDFANQKDLYHYIKSHSRAKVKISEQKIWKVAYELLEGLKKLHELNIIHRDIKPENIFFHNGSAKIGDLNLAKHLTDPFTLTQAGTPCYTAPQVWKEQPDDYKVDIWSLGCVLYCMACLKDPFRAQQCPELMKKITIGIFEPLPNCYSKQLKTFIRNMLRQNPTIRPSAKQLLCEQKILFMIKQKNEELTQKQQLLNTIKFPLSLKKLNEKLPKPKYKLPKTQKNISSEQRKPIEKENKIAAVRSLKLIHLTKNIQNKRERLNNLAYIYGSKKLKIPKRLNQNEANH